MRRSARVSALLAAMAVLPVSVSCNPEDGANRIRDLLMGREAPGDTAPAGAPREPSGNQAAPAPMVEPEFEIDDSDFEWSTGCIAGGVAGSHSVVLASFFSTDSLQLRTYEFSDSGCAQYVGARSELYRYVISAGGSSIDLELLMVDETSPELRGPREPGWKVQSLISVVQGSFALIYGFPLELNWIRR